MAYTRRNQAEDIRANRAWTADAVVDLASIPVKHGDTAFVTGTGDNYLYFDGDGWINLSVTDETTGGTGQSSYTTGDTLYASASNTLAKLGIGAANNVLIVSGGVPAWSSTLSVGAITTSGLLTTTNGQIKFPATQNASADVNTLDDYEEGTWTPVLNFGGGTTGITYNLQLGRYQKIGNTVYISFEVELTAKGSSTGNAQFTGLPFTSSGSRPLGTLTSPYAGNMAGLTSPVSGLVLLSDTAFYLYDVGATGVANLDDTNFTATSYLIGFGFYTI